MVERRRGKEGKEGKEEWRNRGGTVKRRMDSRNGGLKERNNFNHQNFVRISRQVLRFM